MPFPIFICCVCFVMSYKIISPFGAWPNLILHEFTLWNYNTGVYASRWGCGGDTDRLGEESTITIFFIYQSLGCLAVNGSPENINWCLNHYLTGVKCAFGVCWARKMGKGMH